MNTIRQGKARSHKEGIAVNIYRDTGATPETAEHTLLATAYGADESEARCRARVITTALASHYGTKIASNS